MNIKTLFSERGISREYIQDMDKLDGVIITNDDDFTKNLLRGYNYYPVKTASIDVAKKIENIAYETPIIGIGGGKALDIAKKVSYDTNKNLILIPTAPSHDGLVSKNCSLYIDGKRETIPAKYPEELKIPLYLWKNSGRLKKSGICDLISNLIALEDIKLSERLNKESFKEEYKILSESAVDKISYDDRELSEALILSAIAMEETSRYCSGSEHIVERLLEKELNGRYLHGQLAGTGSLISSKLYDIYSDKVHAKNNLFDIVIDKMEKFEVLDFAKEPIKNIDSECLKSLSYMRPERFTIFNVVDSKTADWGYLISELKNL